MIKDQTFTQLTPNDMNTVNDSNEILSRKKLEERKKLLIKIYKNGASEIIEQVETFKIHFSKLWLDINNPIHKRWIEEFAIIFDEDGEDAPIEISFDNVDMYLSKDGDPVIQFDFDDILENEEFNMAHKIFLNDILDEDGAFVETLFIEQLKMRTYESIQLMIELENKD